MLGAPRLRTIQTPSTRSAISAPMQTIWWKISFGNFSPRASRAAASSASSKSIARERRQGGRAGFEVPDEDVIEGALHETTQPQF